MRTLEMSSKSTYKPVQMVLIVMFTGMILYITVFSRTVGTIRIVKGLFWEYQQGFLRDAILNMLLFFPLGFLLEISEV